VASSVAEARSKAAAKRVRFSQEQIDREVLWRSWFPKIQVDWTQELDDDTTRILYDACVSFMESNLTIKFPGKGKLPFRLRDAQKQVLWDWIKYRNNICLKARQIGFSTLVSAYVLWLTFGWGEREIVMLSRTERDSVKLLNKTKYAYKGMPEWVRKRGPELLDRTRLSMTWANDSKIESLPSANDPARGESLFLIVIDEWAFLPSPEDAWSSIEPVIDLGGRAIGISTANIENDFFHKQWQASEAGRSNFHGIFFGWDAVDDRDQAWFDEKVANLAAWQRAREYPQNPNEAFVGSGNPVFNLDIVRGFTAERPIGEFTISGTSRNQIDMFEGGPLLVWETPNDEERWSYSIGADIAQGLDHGDWTVAWVLCVQTNKPVAVWYGKVDPDVFGETILPAIGWYYRHAIIVPEINNHGLTVLKALQRAKYQRIYHRRTFTKRDMRPLESLGWLTTATSKPLMIDELQAFLRETPNIPHDVTLGELRTFMRDEKGRMNGTPHDDTVMALAMAVQGRKYAISEKIVDKNDAAKTKGTMAWWLKQTEKKPDRRGVRPGRI
jgi:hypothetical protein